MALDHATPLLSYDDYAAIDDDRRYEVIDGALLLTPAPGNRHQVLSYELSVQFASVRGKGLVLAAPTDVVFRAERPATILQPDLLFVRQERAAGLKTAKNVGVVPDLVVEILSPSTSRRDLRDKRRVYARHGVAECWIVVPDAEQVQVLTLGPDGAYGKPTVYEPGDQVATPLAPGFALDVAALFAVLAED